MFYLTIDYSSIKHHFPYGPQNKLVAQLMSHHDIIHLYRLATS